MPRALIVGYGNPLRGDDGLGWRAAEILRKQLPGVDVVIAHQLAPEIAEAASRTELAVFLDARVDGVPGELRREELRPAAHAESFTHHLDPPVLLGLARALYGRAPRAVLFSITGEDFGCGERLSAAVEAALPRLVEAVRAEVRG